jgi:hypothetical protein
VVAVESLTFEIARAEFDPYDRTFGVMARSGRDLLAARSFRIAPHIALGAVLLDVDRIVLAWGLPGATQDRDEHFYDVLDAVAQRLDPEPF